MDIDALKATAQHEIDQIGGLLIGTSDWMFENPEIGLQEHQAAARLCEMLSEFGAQVEQGIAGLPTAFKAELGERRPGPRIAIIAEYDALPEVGHGCGHNIIATAAIGAGIALTRMAPDLPGSIVVIGTPAEESAVPNAGGKIPILDHGYFDDVDAAIMIHPLYEDRVSLRPSLVAHGLEISFHGRAAHAAANPHDGINALDALIVMFSSVGLLRQQIRSDARIHGVITHGGGAPNVIPDYTACRMRVRAADAAYADDLVQRVVACAEAGAKATGARMEWREYMPPYLNYVPNVALSDALRQNLESIGRTMTTAPERDSGGSTDFGNVSLRVPSTYAYLRICGKEAGWHTREVAEATRTEAGHAAILDGAKSLAMTALDVLSSPELLDAAKQEHARATAAASIDA